MATKQSSQSAWLDGYHQIMPDLSDPHEGTTVAEKQSFYSANEAVDKA